jgi:hypothetical protein
MIIGTRDTTVGRQHACKTVVMWNWGLSKINETSIQGQETSIQGQPAAAVVTVLRDARDLGDEQSHRKCCDVSEEEFERRYDQVQDDKFWSCQQGTDNSTYFKSKENLNFWSEEPPNHTT